jgi:putative transposase
VKTFRLVDQEREHHAVSLLCAVLRVTRQGYYAWRRREATPGPRRRADAVYCGAIMRLYTKSRETYGAPRITGRLRIEEGIRIGQKRTARLMRELGIKGVSYGKKHPRTTVPDVKAPPAPDLIERDFTATGPDQKWCADITYVERREGYLFLAIVNDAFSRRIVGWSMRDNLEAEIVADAIAMSVARRRPAPGVIHHSDRGSQPGLKGLSQRRLVGGTVGGRRGPRLAFSIRASCVGGRSRRRRLRRGLRGSVC